MLQTFRERLTLVLIGLLPFHALLVTVITKVIAGPDHAPIAWLALWKEAVLGIIILLALAEIIFRNPKLKNLRLDLIDWLIVTLIGLSFVVSILNSQFSILNSAFAFGFKYDFIPLVAFMVLRRVEWSQQWSTHMRTVIIGAASVMCIYG